MEKNVNKPKIIVIMGMTCSGKTILSLEIAKKFNCEIVNFDSTQFYKDLNIVTDKVNVDKYQKIKHHMLSFLPMNENYSIGKFKKKIQKVVDDILKRKKIPLLVGGSGLYLASFLFSYSLINKARDKNFVDLYKFTENKDLYNSLKIIDPTEAKKLHYNDRWKVLRALEIFYSTGKTKTELLNSQTKIYNYNYFAINLEINKDSLKKRAIQRIEKQFNDNIINEVQAVSKKYPSIIIYNSFKIIGYSEICELLDKKITLIEAKEKILKRTLKYAKRQKTFFNNKFVNQYKFDLTQEKNNNKILFLVKNFLL